MICKNTMYKQRYTLLLILAIALISVRMPAAYAQNVSVGSGCYLDIGSGFFKVGGGTLTNNGTIRGTGTLDVLSAAFSNAGDINPGTPDTSPGILSIKGNFSQTSTGVLNIELGGTTAGTGFDQLGINGSATLVGFLNVSLINSFSPSFGNKFQVINYASRNGNFDATNLPSLGSGLTWGTNTGANSITLTVVHDCTDNDGDGYGVGAGCLGPDCDDNDPDIHPGATEVCDGVDNNCDGQTDEGVKSTYYRDADKDGYGNQSNSTEACTQPAGYVLDKTDCDDSDAKEHPGQTWYKDADNDGYSNGTKNTTSCTRPAGYKVSGELTAISGDCNDGNPAINPGATEVCDGVDNDCDGKTDEGVKNTYYRDADGDGHGDPSNSKAACTHPGSGWVTNNGDCDDSDAAINPGATEVIDKVDNDCDGQIDEGGPGPTSCPEFILPKSNFFGKDSGTGSLSVSAPVSCSWTAAVSNDSPWIRITSPTGIVTGNGNVIYSVTANTSGSIRTGDISIKGSDPIQIFRVTQEATCSHSISPVRESFDSSGGTGSLNVSAPASCDWKAVIDADATWINIDSGISGSGDGTVNYTVSAYAGTSPRTGTFAIADETFTVSQLGINPPGSFSLSPTDKPFGSSGGTGSVDVIIPDDSGWTATSDVTWISITSSSIGTGNGTLNFYITPNTSISKREGKIKFADWKNCTCKILTVTQNPLVPCTSTITPTSNSFNAIGGSGSVSVSDRCNSGWMATSDDPDWITIDSGSSGSGAGTVKYKVKKNPSTSPRTGTMTIAGQTFTVVQEGMKSFPEPKIMAMDSDGLLTLREENPVPISVSLNAGDYEGTDADWWLVASTGSAWYYYDLILGWTPGFSVTYPGPLVYLSPYDVWNKKLPPGKYTFYFGVDTIMNGILDFDELHYEFVTAEIIGIEDEDSCNVTISVPSKSFDFTGGSDSFTVNDPCNNGWMVKSNCAWVHIISGNNSGTGNGTVQYFVDFSHARATSRECGINVSVETFEVEQTKNTITDE